MTTQQEDGNFKILIDRFFEFYTHHHVYFKKCKNYNELCDALVVFEDYNLVFQMKTRKKGIVDWNGGYDEGLQQLECNFASVQNGNLVLKKGQGKKAPTLDIKLGSKTFYILLMDGITEDEIEQLMENDTDANWRENYRKFYHHTFPQEIKHLKLNENCFIYNTQAIFETTLKYCTTILDYINFLEFTKGMMNAGSKIIIPHNEVLLTLFLRGNREVKFEGYDYVCFGEDHSLSLPEIEEMLEKERESYELVDKELIKNISEERVVRELVRLRRVDRNNMAKLIKERKAGLMAPKKELSQG